jgi:ABC-type antimicrobial peptide transport system permease subunit
MRLNTTRIALRILRWFCRTDMVKPIEGDLAELHVERLQQSGKLKADLFLFRDVLLLFRPGIIKTFQPSNSTTSPAMFKNYLFITWRNLMKDKAYSMINIGGLAIGMAVALLNGLWISDELSFNKSFENRDQIAMVAKSVVVEGKRIHAGTTLNYPLATEMMTTYRNQFERVARASFTQDQIIANNDKKFASRSVFADPAIAEIFSLKMIAGTRDALKEPNTIMLSESIGRKLFGNTDPLGQVVTVNNKTELKVTGVFADFPMNTKLYLTTAFISWETYRVTNKSLLERAENDWRNHFFNMYVQIPEGKTFEEISTTIINAQADKTLHIPQDAAQHPQVLLFPMRDWYLRPYSREGPGYDTDRLEKLWMMGSIGAFVLILACINFMNLSTARSERRAKEVGVRKTVGSLRRQLITQFYSESLVVVLISFCIALAMAGSLMPWFNQVAFKDLTLPLDEADFWLMSVGVIFVTSLLAGSYPALFLSSFKPIHVLKGTFKAGRWASLPRKALVVFQFAISVILVGATVVIQQQVQHARNRPAGYDQERLIMIRKKTSDFYGKYDVLKNELKKTGAVTEVSESMGKVTEIASGNNGWTWKGSDPKVDQQFGTLAVSHDYGRTIGWEIIEGRDFSREFHSDSSGLIINESAAKEIGMANPVGELVTWTWWVDGRKRDYRILGVVKDMVMNSAYEPTEATVFYIAGFNGTPGWIDIRINDRYSISEALLKIEDVFKKHVPSAPFEYFFVDEEYASKFTLEKRIGTLVTFFASLAILISCLGLFGLAWFVAGQRTKEIGIRKISGASVAQLWRLLSSGFLWLTLIACTIAVPTAWYLVESWLQRFPYRIEVSPWIFAVITGGTIIVALITVSYQAIKASTMNPVKSLRSE